MQKEDIALASKRVIVVMGVTGSGKSTVGKQIARLLGYAFIEGDDFHSNENKKKMSLGIGLNDDDRISWLSSICKHIHQEAQDCVLACSCLKRRYRDIFRAGFRCYFVVLDVSRNDIEARLSSRKGHFATETLLDSQFKDFERPTNEPDCYFYTRDAALRFSTLFPMLQQNSETESKSITPDGGIIKIPIVEKPDAKEIKWNRGCNAQLFYKAFAYIPPQTETTEKHSEKCKSGCSHSEQEKEDLLKQKANLIQSLLSGKKIKEDSSPPDPKQKPVRTLVSDSRKNDPNPFDLRIGYSFSVTAFEICIKTLKVGERARFLCMPSYCDGFAQLETVMRQEKVNRERLKKGLPPLTASGCCAHATPEILELSKGLEECIGVPIEFEFELVSVQLADTFQKEVWEMEPTQKYQQVPLCKQQGGELYKNGKYQEALEKYEYCLGLLESLNNCGTVLDLRKEEVDKRRGIVSESVVPKDNIIELKGIDEMFLACRLNYAACKLKLKDYPAVIQHCSEVLKLDGNNVKALFRRAQAYLETGLHLDLCQKDVECLELVLQRSSSEFQELERLKKLLGLKLKKHYSKEKQIYSKMFA